MSTPLLEVANLSMDFGGLRAINRLDLEVRRGEIVALIGPNGAGKTTFFNCITGLYTPTAGDILIASGGKSQERVNGLKPNLLTQRGMARTFQNIRLFPEMTVLENTMIGRHCRTKAGVLGAILRGRGTRREEREIVAASYAILLKIGLAEEANTLAKNLSYGGQRRLEIARALATEPFLLLDEPAAGLNGKESEELKGLMHAIRDAGIAILLIEHDMRLVMSISDRIYVMDYGQKIAEGAPEAIRNNPLVVKAYLGEELDA